MKFFRRFKIEQVPRIENTEADGLARLAFGFKDDTLGQTPIELLSESNIRESANHVMPMDYFTWWVDPILEYLTKGKIPEDKNKARRLKYQANRYTVLNGKLYQRGFTVPYLRCLRPEEAEGNPRRSLWQPLWKKEFGPKSPQTGVLLADHVEGLS